MSLDGALRPDGALPAGWESNTWDPDAVVPALRDHLAAYLDAHDDAILPIVSTGAPVLRQVTDPYRGQLGDLLPRFVEAMRTTMYAAPGVGLAATQVGVGLAIAVIEDPGMGADLDTLADARERVPLDYQVIINPAYEAMGSHVRAFYEGCLSVPDLQGVVARPRTVLLRSQDLLGAEHEQEFTGWPARIVQHETDHLGGTLYLDRVETRSITTTDNYGQYWAGDPTPARAAEVLGFPLAKRAPLA